MGLRDSPVAVFVVSALSAVPIFDPSLAWALLAALWANLGTLFTASTIGAFTLPQLFPTNPLLSRLVPVITAAAAVFAVGYLGKLVWTVISDFRENYERN